MIEFLNPFLWGLALSLIPILLYFYKTLTKKKLILPTLRFIKEEEKSRAIRINIEILKVLLRIMIISLIVIIFSQPLISKSKSNETFILLDTTYSAKDNFDNYLSFLREYLSNLPSSEKVTIIDLSGTKIYGKREEILDKLKLYLPVVGKLDKRIFQELKGKEVILLSDGQKNIIELLEKENIKITLIKFPFSIPNALVNITSWKRIGKIESKIEIIPKEKVIAEISLIDNKKEKRILSLEISTRKVFEIKLTNDEGIAFLNTRLISDKKTNNFVEALYFFDNTVNLIADKEDHIIIEKALETLGIKENKNSKYSILVSDFVNVDKLRNTIVIPKNENSKILLKNENLFLKKKAEKNIEEYKFSYMPLGLINEFNLPSGVRVIGTGNKAIIVYDAIKNNAVIVGIPNYKSPYFPIFLKETMEFLMLDSKTIEKLPYQYSPKTNILVTDSNVVIFKTPEEEICETINYESKRNFLNENELTILLFLLLLIIMSTERIVSSL